MATDMIGTVSLAATEVAAASNRGHAMTGAVDHSGATAAASAVAGPAMVGGITFAHGWIQPAGTVGRQHAMAGAVSHAGVTPAGAAVHGFGMAGVVGHAGVTAAGTAGRQHSMTGAVTTCVVVAAAAGTQPGLLTVGHSTLVESITITIAATAGVEVVTFLGEGNLVGRFRLRMVGDYAWKLGQKSACYSESACVNLAASEVFDGLVIDARDMPFNLYIWGTISKTVTISLMREGVL